MNNLKSYILFAFLILLYSCSSKSIPTAEVGLIGKEEQGTISVKSTGYGKKDFEAIENAEINALNAILFRGIPQTDIENAMIGTNESQIRSKNEQYFEGFYKSKRYKSFIMSSNEISPIKTVNGYKKSTLKVKVNLNSLRRDLENSGVIRKFGF